MTAKKGFKKILKQYPEGHYITYQDKMKKHEKTSNTPKSVQLRIQFKLQ